MPDDSQTEALTTLVSVMESTMTDMVVALENYKGPALDGIERTLSGLVHAVTAIASKNSQPTPVTVEAVMPAQPAPVVHFTPQEQRGAKWKVTYPTQYGDRTMTIERIA